MKESDFCQTSRTIFLCFIADLLIFCSVLLREYYLRFTHKEVTRNDIDHTYLNLGSKFEELP